MHGHRSENASVLFLYQFKSRARFRVSDIHLFSNTEYSHPLISFANGLMATEAAIYYFRIRLPRHELFLLIYATGTIRGREFSFEKCNKEIWTFQIEELGCTAIRDELFEKRFQMIV